MECLVYSVQLVPVSKLIKKWKKTHIFSIPLKCVTWRNCLVKLKHFSQVLLFNFTHSNDHVQRTKVSGKEARWTSGPTEPFALVLVLYPPFPLHDNTQSCLILLRSESEDISQNDIHFLYKYWNSRQWLEYITSTEFWKEPVLTWVTITANENPCSVIKRMPTSSLELLSLDMFRQINVMFHVSCYHGSFLLLLNNIIIGSG